MTALSASLKKPSSRGLAELPACDDATGFVAHLALCVLGCHLRLTGEARMHVECAADIIERQSGNIQTLRSAQPARLVRVSTEADGVSAVLILPMIGDMVVTPIVSLETMLPALRGNTSVSAVHLRDVAVEHVTLRLRMSRLKIALAALRDQHDLEILASGVSSLLQRCVGAPDAMIAPLDGADAYFSLARAFTRMGNYAVVALALEKANACVQEAGYSRLSGRIADIAARLGASAS